MQGKPLTTYDLLPCDGDIFYWPAGRKHELVGRGMWFAPFPQFHISTFATTDKRVLHMTWQHERLLEADQFDKDQNDAGSKL
jgi:hypothetical protein